MGNPMAGQNDWLGGPGVAAPLKMKREQQERLWGSELCCTDDLGKPRLPAIGEGSKQFCGLPWVAVSSQFRN